MADIIHSPVLGNAVGHDRHASDTALVGIGPDTCVAVLAPFEPRQEIIVRVKQVERWSNIVGSTDRMPVRLVGRIEDDQNWGSFSRPFDPAYAPGALIRFHVDNVTKVF